MRTLLLTLSALLLISIVAMYSCKKEKSETATPAASLSDEQLVGQVHWFIDAAKDVKEGKYLKSGEKMVLDSAIYYIGNTLNYKYGFVSQKFSKLRDDTVMVSIPYLYAEGKMYLVDALFCYNHTIDKIRAKYSQRPELTKNLVCCVVQNAGLTVNSDSINLRIIAQIGLGQPVAPTQEEGYFWSRDGGDCEGIGNLGAPNLLETFEYGAIYLPYPGAQAYYTEVGTHLFGKPSLHLNPNGGPIDNFCDYQIYQAQSNIASGITYDVKCIDAITSIPGINQTEIEFYHYGLLAVITDTLSSIDMNYMNVTIESESKAAPFTYVITNRHMPKIKYGHIHFRPGGSVPFPVNIMD